MAELRTYYRIQFRQIHTNGMWHTVSSMCTSLEDVEEEIRIRTEGEKEKAVLGSLEIRVIKVTEEEVPRA